DGGEIEARTLARDVRLPGVHLLLQRAHRTVPFGHLTTPGGFVLSGRVVLSDVGRGLRSERRGVGGDGRLVAVPRQHLERARREAPRLPVRVAHPGLHSGWQAIGWSSPMCTFLSGGRRPPARRRRAHRPRRSPVARWSRKLSGPSRWPGVVATTPRNERMR